MTAVMFGAEGALPDPYSLILAKDDEGRGTFFLVMVGLPVGVVLYVTESDSPTVGGGRRSDPFPNRRK